MSAPGFRISSVVATMVTAVAVLGMGVAPARAAGVGVSSAGDAVVQLSDSEAAVFRLPLSQGQQAAGATCGAINYSLNGQREAYGLALGVTQGECLNMAYECASRISSHVRIVVDPVNRFTCSSY